MSAAFAAKVSHADLKAAMPQHIEERLCLSVNSFASQARGCASVN